MRKSLILLVPLLLLLFIFTGGCIRILPAYNNVKVVVRYSGSADGVLTVKYKGQYDSIYTVVRSDSYPLFPYRFTIGAIQGYYDAYDFHAFIGNEMYPDAYGYTKVDASLLDSDGVVTIWLDDVFYYVDDIYEPDDSIYDAFNILEGETQYRNLSTPVDVDYVSFFGVTGRTYTIKATVDWDDATDTELFLLNHQGIVFEENDDVAFDDFSSEIRFTAQYTGTYYIKTTVSSNAVTFIAHGPYRLSLAEF